MKTARTIGLGLGLIILVGAGAATFSRAQQPGEKIAHQVPTRMELRERVIKFQTEIDLLQVEYDAARANLAKAIKFANKDIAEFRDQLLARMPQESVRKKIAEEIKLFEALKKTREATNSQESAAIRPQILTLLPEEDAKKWIKILDSPAGDKASEEELKLVEEEINLYKALLKGGYEAKAAATRLAQLEVLAGLEFSGGESRLQKEEFALKARSLHEKKLDLAEAEKQYQSEAR
jgi:hypothetical protein